MRRLLADHVLAAAIAAGAVVVIAIAAWRLRDTYVGDAAVYLPYARNAADGHLFQFNVGEFSSGSTSALWSVLLGIPFLFGAGLAGAKVFSAVFAVVGLGATILAARHLSRSWTAAAVAGLLALGTMTLFALSLYESGLAVTFGALSIIAGERVVRRWRDAEAASLRPLLPLVAVWAALPLARPDSVILVAAEAVALLAFAPVARRQAAPVLLAGLALAAIPAAAYFGYSQIELGTFSTSSQGRSEALRESTDKWIGPLYLSWSALKELFSTPWVFALVPSVGGFALLARRRPDMRWVSVYAGLALVGYLALLTFITPAFYDTSRYLVPLVPLLVAGVAYLLASAAGSRLWPVAVVAGALLIGGSAVLELRDYQSLARSIGITEHEVFERDVSAIIGRMASPGDEVLSYEVQMRYFLRDDVDVLSEDGITDGKVAPYQRGRDLTGFLVRYRPRWWIADANAVTRPYMRGSVLDRAFRAFEASEQPRSRVLDGIRFTLVARRSRPLATGFGGWQMLFELDYGAVGRP